MKLSQVASAIKPSATLAVSGKAKEMRAAGINVINLSAGEPDFDTPERISAAARQAITEGQTKYTLTPGIPPLREAIVDKFARDYGYSITADQVVVSCGAKHSLFLAFMGLVNPGDEVIIPAPYWVSYPPQVRLFGGEPVIVETGAETCFKLTPQLLKSAITPKTRVLLINSPSNPTGQLYSREELAQLAEIVLESGIAVVSDDIYEKLIYDGGEFSSMAQISVELRQQCVVINGVSKCSAMTGWRIGYMVAPASFAAAVTRLQGQMTSNACSISQHAAIEAIAGEASELPGWLESFQSRRDRMVEMLNAIEGISCQSPGGAFYVFADIRELLGRKAGDRELDDDMAWAGYLLEEAHVACVPGSPFGGKGYLRLSFATSLEIIEEGIRRMGRAIENTQ